MALSKHNPADTEHLENFISSSNEPIPEATNQLDELVNLLIDLDILKDREKRQRESISSDGNGHIEEIAGTTSDRKEENAPEKPPLGELNLTTMATKLLPPARDIENSEKAENNIKSNCDCTPELANLEEIKAADKSSNNSLNNENITDSAENLGLANQARSPEIKEENVEDLYDAYKRLQSALLGPELDDLQHIVTGFDNKVTTIEHQIYDPTELIDLLLPVISEILSRKVAESAESRGSIAEAMVPIIDEVIKAKVREDREAIGKALADALPSAISEKIRTHPEEFAKAIAPDIAAAIKEQIRLAPQAMVDALYPIIHTVIESKHQEDMGALATVIAPLLPPAIAQQIRQSPREIAQAIAPEMAAAIREQVKLDRGAMVEALAPEMGKAIKAQIELERDAMVDALYPVIGSTIAKYMADAIRSINEKVENTLSVEGINRKIRAAMQGVSEAELILKEAIPFKVRAVFLIHKQSGLVIAEVQNTGEQTLESDMVAGMLTAIRSFVNDCIARSGDVSEIDAIDYGNSKIILEVAGYCYLAVVTQGETPQWYIYRMQEALHSIVQITGDAIENYEGDPSVMPESVAPILESLTQIAATPNQKKRVKPNSLLVIGSAVAAVILLPFGYFQYRHSVERRIEQETTKALASAPELAIYNLSVDADGGKLKLAGKLPNPYLRQRAEQIVKQVAPKQQLENQIIAVEVPADPVLAAAEVQRVTATLNQMNGVAIKSRYADGKVTVEGRVAQVADSQKITQAFKQIPGVKAVTNTVQLAQLSLPVRIYFDGGETELKAANKGKILQVKAFLARYPEMALTIIGHSDGKGKSTTNQQLALARAEAVRQALLAESVDSKRLQVVATPNPPLGLDSKQPLWLSRCVRFQPVVSGLQSK